MELDLSRLLGLPTRLVSAVLSKLGDPSEDSDSHQFLTCLKSKLEQEAPADDSEDQKAQLQYDKARLETEVHRLNKQIGQLKSALESASAETRAAQTELHATKARLDEALVDAQTRQAQAAAHVALEAQLRAQVEQMCDAKRDLLAQLAERRDQLDDRAGEAQRLNDACSDLRQQRARDHDELARLRSQVSVADVGEHMLRQSLELTKSQVTWLDDELGKTQAELQAAKAELARAATTGRAEVLRLRAEAEAQADVVAGLQARGAQLERTVREKLDAERAAREEGAEQAEQFRCEMAAQKRLCVEWERAADAAKQHVRSVEESLREADAHRHDADAHAAQRLADTEQALADAHARAAALDEQLRTANALLSEAAAPARAQSLLLSPTASAAARLQGAQPRLNITQLYADKAALEDRLRDADAEIACLRESMEQILAEIEERGPIIAAERDEHQRLLVDADRIAQDLAAARQENAAASRVLRDALMERDLLRRQADAELQQSRDLARQVARLLRAAEETRLGGRPLPEGGAADDAPANPLASPMARRVGAGAGVSSSVVGASAADDEKWLSDVDRVISQKLVTFADITELVSQNRRLLRTTRELAAQVAHEEQLRREEAEDEVKGALEQAESMLDRLTLELETTKTRMGVISRERDMLKAINPAVPLPQTAEEQGLEDDAQPPPPVADASAFNHVVPRARSISHAASATMLPVPTEDALAQLQSDYDLYKSETRKTRVLLEHDASKLQAEVSELRVRAAKAEAQGQFDADRIAMFVSDLAARQKEIEHLRLATSRLHSQVESYERQLDSQGQEAAAERAELSRLRRQTTLLEAERDNLRQNEQRWRSEEQRLVAERSSMTLILENTTKMRDEWQRASEDQVVQVRERLDATRRDADSVRQELKQARDSAERAQFMFETELRELRGQVQLREDRVSQLQAQVAVAQELNTKAQAERRDIEAVRDALQRQVATLEGRIQSQEELMLRAKGQGHTVSKESLLAVQLQDARSQLEALQSELETTATRAEDYRQLSSSNDASLKQLSETYDQYKAEQERVIAEQRAKISRLEAGLSDSTEALTRCREELDSATRTSQEVQAKLNETQSASASRVAQLESEVEHKTAALDALREDMRRHEGVAQNMQEQYEREIVAHAKDIEGTLLAREKLRESQKQLSAATSELLDSQQAAALLQAEVDQTAVRAAAEVQAAESQLSRIKRQNALLLAHLESIGHRVPDITIDPEQIASSIVPQHDGSDGATTVSSASSEANSVGGLREVIVYLRRERDLVSAQLDLAQQESQRWRQQSSHTQRALDEVRKELQQYVPPASSTDGSPSDASSLGQKQADRSPADIIPPGEGPIGLTALQRQACRQQIEQTVLLRESNSVLRSELTSARARLRELELELSKVKDQEVPQLRSTNATLEAELGATRAQIDQLQAMCDHWKQRHEKVLAKYEMIEPEEHEAIKAENSRLKSESEALHMESTSLRQANAGLQQDVAKLQEQIKHSAEQKTAVFTGRIRSLQQDVSRLQAQIEAQLAELDSEREKASSHEAGARQLREQLDHAQAEAQTAEAGAQGSKAKYEKLHNAFQKLRQQSVEKLDQSNKAIKAHEATIQSLSEQVDTLSAQVESLRAAGIKSAAVPAAPETAERAENLQRVTAEIAELTSEKDQAVEAHLKLAQELQQTQGLLHEARAQLLTQAGQQTQESTFDQAAVPTDASVAEVEQLRARLAEADAKVKDYEGQLEQLKARALKYARDNKVLQSRATDLERQLAELKSQNGGSDADLQKQLDEAKRQLSEAEAKIEQAQTNAKKTAELRSKLQISRANKRADDLEKQVALLQAKLGPLESSGGSLDQPAPADETGSLKRPSDASDTPAKKAHTDDA